VSVEAFSFEQLDGGVVEASGASTAAARAASIVESALAEAEHIRAEAREAGAAEGRAAGFEAAKAELEPGRATLAAAAAGVRSTLSELTAQAEREAVELALALADKILSVALELRPELVADLVAGALRGVVERELVVEVNPEDVDFLHGVVEGIEVAPERRVPRGSCVVRTPEGEIDARIDQQLQRAAEALRSAL
jgi:flagellar biosynthesis/type III secretory pathway protein FliH